MSIQAYADDFFTLVEAGFIAIHQYDEDAAKKLFRAASLLDSTSTLPLLGQGYMHLCKLELKLALPLFEEILAKDPANGMAKTLLGLALSFNPAATSQGEKTLEEALQSASDPMVKELATSTLEFVRKFIKKAPSPTQGAAQSAKRG